MTASNNELFPNVKELGRDFRRYLERGKFNEEMTRTLLALYNEPEWPQNPNEYVCKKLAECCKLTIQDDQELKSAKDKIKELETTVAKLKEELSKKQEKHSRKHKE